MKHEIIPFNYNGHNLSTITDEQGEVWFIAKEVAEILDYSDSHEMTTRLDADEKQNRQIAGFGNRGVTTINESGLYSAILGSTKPEAKPFKKWVTSEVLPSIRKTGSYTASNVVRLPDFTNPAEAARAWADQVEARQLAEQTKSQIGSRREATAMNAASQAVKKANKLEIELDRAKQYATVKRMQMIHHGQPFNWRMLKAASTEMGIPAIEIFDANYGTVKAYHAEVWMEVYALPIEEGRAAA